MLQLKFIVEWWRKLAIQTFCKHMNLPRFAMHKRQQKRFLLAAVRKHPNTRAVIDSGELIRALSGPCDPLEELHVQLQAMPGLWLCALLREARALGLRAWFSTSAKEHRQSHNAAIRSGRTLFDRLTIGRAC